MTSEKHNSLESERDAVVTQQGLKYLWQKAAVDDNASKQLAFDLHLPLPIAQILYARGWQSKKQALDFLIGDPNFCPDSAINLLKDAVKAVERIEQAIQAQEKILIFGDYDVDGMTATSIALLCLKPLGAQIVYLLPHRVKDGYGISSKAVKEAFAQGFSLIITVDNGTCAYAAAQAAQELGIDLIITDHHQPKPELPACYALVNPHQADCHYPFKDFCGAGVIFKLMQLLYKRQKKTLPAKVLELMAMGTIADVVALVGENRHWVKRGLQQINESPSFSFLCLAANAGKAEHPLWKSQDIGFGIAPQLNALGRLADPKNGVLFLAHNDPDEIAKIAQNLWEMNQARKKVEQQILAEVESQIRSGKINLAQTHVIIAASDSWPPGVVGLVAGRLVHNYGKPALLFHLDKNSGLAKGSARSIAAYNIFAGLSSVQHLLNSFGGHQMAAGVSLSIENLDTLKQLLHEDIAINVTPQDLVPKIITDAKLTLDQINRTFMQALDQLEPFGHANPVPTFIFENIIQIKPPSLLQDKHVKLTVLQNGVIKPVVFFQRPELFFFFSQLHDQPFTLVAQLQTQYWQNQIRIELLGIDAKLAN